MKIAFIGPRGAGKSKISRKYSKLTGKLLLSTDQLVCYEAGGRTIEQIVKEEGWSSFRNREYELLKKLNKMDNIVIDCGGGILFDIDPQTEEEIESERKISLLKENTFIIYILRELEWLLNKDLKNAERPDLNHQKSYLEILNKRLPIYEKYADYILDMRGKEIKEGIEELLNLSKIY
jgi:shikimate kinase